jgi:hypothetical protein
MIEISAVTQFWRNLLEGVFGEEGKQLGPNDVVDWQVAEEKGWPICSFKLALQYFSDRLFRNSYGGAFKFRLYGSGRAEIVGQDEVVIARIHVNGARNERSSLEVEYLAGMISAEDEAWLGEQFPRMHLIACDPPEYT